MNKILIVDSNQTNIDIITNLLDSANCKVYPALTGKIALAKAKMINPDLIVTDSDLLDLSGYDLCKELKSTPETKNCLVLIMILVETRSNILKALNSGTDDYIPKNFDKTIFISKIKSLLRISHLNDKISKQYNELKERDELLSFQLKTAQKVQRSIIKEFNENILGIQLVSKYLPALDIGGDFLKVKQIDKENIGVILGDVSGHGISAALLTSMLCMMYDSLAEKYTSPKELLNAMNAQFCKSFDTSETQVYACIFYAVINTEKKIITYSNAGQSFPIYANFNDGTVEELQLGGIPVGMLTDTIYDECKKEYSSNDVLIIHTDGLSDCLYKSDTETFTSKLGNIILYSAMEETNMEEVANSVLGTFCKYDEEKKYEYDDVSIILCKFP